MSSEQVEQRYKGNQHVRRHRAQERLHSPVNLASFIDHRQLTPQESFSAPVFASCGPKPFWSLSAHKVAGIVEVPSRVSSLLSDLRHPVRLPILLALSEGNEMSATQLADRLGTSYSAVAYALDKLRESGYVEIARVEVLHTVPGNTLQRLYRGRGEDWRALVDILDGYARGD